MSIGVAAGRRVGVSAVVCAVLALAVTAGALGDSYTVRYKAADQAAARAVVPRRADLGTTAQWKGGPAKPDLSSLTCPGYRPKQSDLIVTGAAASEWTTPGIDFDAQAVLLQTSRMVTLDWQRSVTPKLARCLRSTFPSDATTKLVSLRKISFPRVATYTVAYRALLDVVDSGKPVRVMIDLVAIGQGRAELMLITTAPYAIRGPVVPAEIRLARLLVSRVPT